MSIKRFQDLDVWQKARQLVLECYRIAAAFPADERYALAQQLRRAVTSIPLNIAEGHGIGARGSFARHVWIARGSTMEVEAVLQLAEDLGYLTSEQLTEARELCDRISRMLLNLQRALTRSTTSG